MDNNLQNFGIRTDTSKRILLVTHKVFIGNLSADRVEKQLEIHKQRVTIKNEVENFLPHIKVIELYVGVQEEAGIKLQYIE